MRVITTNEDADARRQRALQICDTVKTVLNSRPLPPCEIPRKRSVLLPAGKAIGYLPKPTTDLLPFAVLRLELRG